MAKHTYYGQVHSRADRKRSKITKGMRVRKWAEIKAWKKLAQELKPKKQTATRAWINRKIKKKHNK